jgi:TolA-binding protein
MNRFLLILALSVASVASAPAQDRADQAAAILERQKIEEDYRRLQAMVNALVETQEVLQKRIADMGGELQRLRRDQAELAGTTVSKDELAKLISKIEQQIEAKRESDKKAILEAISGLRKMIAAAPAPSPKPPPRTEPPPIDEVTYDYPVSKDDTVSAIIDAYNRKYREEDRGAITLFDVRRVNPDANLDRIYPGQVIRIPEPSAQP